eukprot:Nitzschia sp. Nitz4//scaffold100_size80364//42082//45208//NITZ4_005347-RA/size80364-augustus-gene-0.7-mRNA-1//1//CDS//3329532103//3659//frame0
MVDHGKSTKRKKFHDKDKYYNLAKEQGLRSRAAFKLTQINRQYSVLDNAKVVLDLCAAPGGWTQIASRVCGPNTQVVAVDILPIRNLHNKNITTIVGDITTDKCKAEIQRAIPKSHDGASVDVVLHDGAPNVGASYDKDAYEQMELSVHALRCATQHLKRNGVFVTKIYRSRDSTSFQWVAQQLFKEISVFKPKASRPQSAEIFYICQGYHKPDKIDPRLLDPKHIFELVQGDTTGGSGVDGSKFHVFHKNWDQAKRQRGGYDTEHLDATLRHIEPLSKFVFGTNGRMPAIQLLSQSTGLSFHCPTCVDTKSEKKNKEEADCQCQFLLRHPLTTPEIKECVVDLKVLNKGDFKGLMIWREKMIQALSDMSPALEEGDDDDSDDEDVSDDDKSQDEEGEEEEVQNEIKAMRERRLKEKKKLKKKERKLAAKKRRQAAFGMDLNAVEVQEDDQFFSLDTLKSNKDLQKVSDVNLDKSTDEQVFGAESDDSEDDEVEEKLDNENENAKMLKLEKDLDAAYSRYLTGTTSAAARNGTRAAKRSKKLMREKLAQESHEDQELLLTKRQGLSGDAKMYADMLQGPKDSDDEDEDSSSDEEESPAPEAKRRKVYAAASREKEDSNPLIHELPDDPTNVKTARWFNNPLFASIGEAAENAQSKAGRKAPKTMDIDDESDDADDERDSDARSKSKKKSSSSAAGLDADDVLNLMPKTDKEKRHEKRLKAIARDERRQARKAKRLGEAEGEFDLAPGEEEDEQENDISQFEGMSEERKRKLLEARKLIKAGMGHQSNETESKGSGFEVVEADRPLPVVDKRKYDSDHEDYDSDDYAKTMALGTMMLRQSKAKALVDASYNRYAWNDPEDLPEWFVDDESRHYRPQLPIPPALMEKMKEKMLALSTKPIAKVAEARARKNRKAKHKLAAAKKKAQAIAGSSEISETMKLKQISKALRSEGDNNKGSKNYVVSKKGGKKVKGAVMVDKRMKNDKKSMDRAQKKKSGGKKGGLTGSKKRRHHK